MRRFQKLVLIVVTGVVTSVSGSRALAQTPEQTGQLPQRLPAQLVQDFHSAFGAHHARAVHAKGVILRGSFAPDRDASRLCRAALFTQTAVPVIVRFSDFTGIPNIPDTSMDANPRGLAIKFLMPDGSNLDIVTHSFNGFPVSTAAEFSTLLQAIGASGTGAPKPTALDNFLAGHPKAKQFFTTQKPPPESFATAAYYGVNAFYFTTVQGESRAVRYQFVPAAGEHYLSDAALKGKSPDYLMTEIQARVASQPITFTWWAQLAEEGDVIDDPATAWPASRKRVRLGVVTIEQAGPNTAQSDRSLLFLPGTLLPGIEVADPMLTIRNASYPVSYSERQQ